MQADQPLDESNRRREPRDMPMSIRWKSRELDLLRERADACSIPLADFIRRDALGRALPSSDSRVTMTMVNELRRLGGLLKHIHTQSDGMYSDQTMEVLRTINTYLRHLTKEQE